ncbi:hypothetical protein O181_110941 [Austropuccinia psidii MF-1]|uniref:Uncharacterized protein n=1 Tax=Austropuccinia psidii MF-1 TaxID=1389203 RepID=A0A9Q3K068_9BASI|nr:hypothetical protein [Austropuccinia psidii MF-1]
MDQRKELEMNPALEKEGPVMSTSSRKVQRQAQRTSEETKRSKEQSRQGKRKYQLEQTIPTAVQFSPIGTFSHQQVVQYGQNSFGVHSQGTGKGEKDVLTKRIVKIRYNKSIMDVKFNKINTELKKLISNIVGTPLV